MNTCKMLSTVLGIQVGVAALMPAILASKFKVSLGYRAEMLSQKKKTKTLPAADSEYREELNE